MEGLIAGDTIRVSGFRTQFMRVVQADGTVKYDWKKGLVLWGIYSSVQWGIESLRTHTWERVVDNQGCA